MVSYQVTRRYHEIGLRIALGARGGDIARMVVAEVAGLSLAGIAAGLAGSVLGGRLAAGLLFEVPRTDPPTMLSASLALNAVALLASYLPARRAARAHPVDAFRHE